MNQILRLSSYFFITLSFIIFLPVCQFSQWSMNSNENTKICDLNGEQALSKIVSTSNGGCYISWFDNRDGSYAVYLQRLNELGKKQWDENGLLVSNHPQNSWLVDYDLICDDADNAIIVFSDIRNGIDLSVFAYKINPSGDFLWGSDGIGLSSATEFQPNAKVTQATDGTYVVAWIVSASPQYLALQKLSSDGQKQWGDNPLILSGIGSASLNYPDLIASDNGSVILFYTSNTGSFPALTVNIYVQKISFDGTKLWGDNGINIQNAAGISSFHKPNLQSDENNGAFIAWHDDRNSDLLQSAFVQHVNSNGDLLFPANGAEASLSFNRHKFNPVIAYNAPTDDLFLFWNETNSSQSQTGIYGQKFSAAGDRLWTDEGKMFKPISDLTLIGLDCTVGGNNVYAFYFQGNFSGIQNNVESFSVDLDGVMNWTGSYVVMSDPTQEKLHLVSTISTDNISKVSWTDRRNDAGGIYAQNINTDGTLGNTVIPVELLSFTAAVINSSVELKWTTATETNNAGFEVERTTPLPPPYQGGGVGDGGGWKMIGVVAGHGTTTEPKNYSFTDNTVAHGIYYYRLKQIDFNGSFEYSNAVEISFAPTEFVLEQNYPNPFNPGTKIKFTIPANQNPLLGGLPGRQAGARDRLMPVQLKVYDILGTEIATLVNEQKSPGSYEIEFDATKLSSGIYYYKLETESFVDVKKMMLVK